MDDRNESLRDRCYCFPYGSLHVVPMTCTIAGLIFYHIAAFGCKMLQFVPSGFFDYFLFDYEGEDDKLYVGYWGYHTSNDGCVAWKKEDIYGILKFGRFIGILGIIFIWAIFVALVVAFFFKYPYRKVNVVVISVFMGIVSFFSFLLLFGLAEAEQLQLAGGGIMAIMSGLFWACGSISMFFCMKERPRSVPVSSITTSTRNAPKNPKISWMNDILRI